MTIKLTCGHEVADEHQTHYCSYIGLHDLLGQQAGQLRHPDERLFITTHQSVELWFQQIVFDLRRCIDAIDADNIGLAIWLMRRLYDVARLVVTTTQVLDRMAPTDFFVFRPMLNPASGHESIQFREIELLAGLRDPSYRDSLQARQLWTDRLEAHWQARSLQQAFGDTLARRGVALAEIYTVAPAVNPHADLFLLAEHLLDFDEAVNLWNAAHVSVAERAIGPSTAGTGLSGGVSYLSASAAAKGRLFPELWNVRMTLWKEQSQLRQQAHQQPQPAEPPPPQAPADDAFFHELVERQAARTPGAVAVVCADSRLSYAELNVRANQLARLLRAQGVGPESVVGICLERSVAVVVAVLGVLKAGGAYVPLDPSYPAERLAFMLGETQPRVLITQQALLDKLPATSAAVLCLDTEAALAQECGADLPRLVGPDNLAYIIYTSGSTGTPKGVMIEHKGLRSLAAFIPGCLPLRPESRVLQFASFSFDVAVWDMVLAFSVGATLVIAPEAARGPNPSLIRLLEEERVTVATLPPAVLEVLPAESFPALEAVVSTGEACTSALVARWSVGRRFFNGYGPTETTIGATVGVCTPGEERPSIGGPFANMQIHLLDANLEPVPAGEAGEIYIGGVGVARGYLSRPALSAERFVPDPFSSAPGARLYRTGDQARRRPDGELEFVGRIDSQVKLHGYRIELGEVEAALSEHPLVQQCAVALREAPSTGKRLVAYVVPAQQDAQEAQVERWERVGDQVYAGPAASDDPTLNFVGWNSSFTGQPIPEAEIRAVVEDTVARVRALGPRRILELGCGTGMLLFRLAPDCERYWASDLSAAALTSISQHLERLPQVTLLHRPAHDLSDVPEASYDLVLLNSVAQYFPSVSYLVQVLEGAVRVLRPGGKIFIGDVRNLSLLPALAAGIELRNAPAGITVAQLKQRAQRRVELDDELVLDPEFFTALAGQLPQICHIDIQFKRGLEHNEFTCFHYDAVLTVGGDAPALCAPERVLDWRSDRLSLDALRQELGAARPRSLVVTGVPNARLASAAHLLRALEESSDDSLVGEIDLADGLAGVEPEEVWAIEAELPYTVRLDYTAGDAGRFDIVLQRRGEPGVVGASCPAHRAESSGPLQRYAHEPLAPAPSAPRIAAELRRHLQERLPAHMVPSAVVLLDALPLTPSGKVDRAALPAPDRAGSGPAVQARNGLEAELVDLWETLLGMRPGVDDTFTGAGGNSLLAAQLAVEIAQSYGVELPLSSIGELTVEQLAALVEQPAPERTSPLVLLHSGETGVPIFLVHPVGGSVAAYRELVDYLDRGQTVYGLEAETAAAETAPVTIEALAQRYLAAIREVRPRGPYQVGGWSFGGLVASELAAQLQRAGEQVELLVLFDTWAPVPGNEMADYNDPAIPVTFFAKDLQRLAGRALQLASAQELRSLDEPARLEYLYDLARQANLVPAESGRAVIEQRLRSYQAHVWAVARYRPSAPLACPITLFQASHAPAGLTPRAALGWTELTSSTIVVEEVPGDHLTMFTPPNIQPLAQAFGECVQTMKS
jgi:amino acid adenylation domain-containing protein